MGGFGFALGRHWGTPSWFEAREGLAPHHEDYWQAMLRIGPPHPPSGPFSHEGRKGKSRELAVVTLAPCGRGTGLTRPAEGQGEGAYFAFFTGASSVSASATGASGISLGMRFHASSAAIL
jgi:hypothetical protein